MSEPVATANIPLQGADALRVERWFYIGVSVMMVVFNVVAFARPLLDPSLRKEPLPLTPLLTAHAAVAVTWLLLFVLQATLVATRRTHVHRRVGVLGAALAVAFVVLGYFTAIEAGRRGFDLGGNSDRVPHSPLSVDPRATGLGVLYDLFAFSVLVGAALWYRSRPAIHKRLMLIALLGALTPAPLAHLIGSWIGPQQWAGFLFPASLACFLSLVLLHDRMTEGRIHPVSLWGSALVLGANAFFFGVIIRSSGWVRFSHWLLG